MTKKVWEQANRAINRQEKKESKNFDNHGPAASLLMSIKKGSKTQCSKA
jgi:hypothetical protein